MPYLYERTLKAILSGMILLGISFVNLAQETDSPSLTIEQRITQAKLQLTELTAELKANKKKQTSCFYIR